MFLVAPCWRLQLSVIVAFLIDAELLAELIDNRVVQYALLSLLFLASSTQLALQHWLLELVLGETFIEGAF